MPDIDPSSRIDTGFEIEEGVTVGRNCTLMGRGRIGRGTHIGHNVVINGDVTTGPDCRLGHSVILSNNVSLGARNVIFPFCVIGESGQHPDLPVISGGVEIGNDNTFREFMTIHAPTVEALTSIGSHCFMMAYCHIAHDCRVGDHVKLANAATLAGHVTVGDYAYIALHSIVHQRIEIGAHTMIGMNTAISRHVPPFAVMAGEKFLKVNVYGLERRGFSEQDIEDIRASYGFSATENAVAFRGPAQSIQDFAARHEGQRIHQPFRRSAIEENEPM